MKNRGFGKYEILIVIVTLIIVSYILLRSILGGVNNQKFTIMKDNAINFSKVVTTNIDSFYNTNTVYLGEVFNEKLLTEMKSPFSKNSCSKEESKVIFENGVPKVTLKCDEFLIENVNFTKDNSIIVYEVGKWEEKDSKERKDKQILYNCEKDNKLLFDNYYEELYFVSLINEKYQKDYYQATSITNICDVVKKTFYRTKKEVSTT